MKKDSKIYIAGHRGLVGSAIYKALKRKGYTNVIGRSSSELDLKDIVSVREFFKKEKPEYVILAAAKVGGIVANNTYRADFIFDNLQIQQNVIGESYRSGVTKLLFLGSTCIYPKNATQPMVEDELLKGELEYTNEPYAIAKIAGLKLCESFNIQYGTNFIAVMPTNLYGLNDNFDLEKSHVLPAMIRKMHLAKLLEQNNWISLREDLINRHIDGVDENTSEESILNVLAQHGIALKENSVEVRLWGSGTPLREFLWSDDMADASIHIMENVDFKDLAPTIGDIKNCHINIGSGVELSIKHLSEIIKSVVGFSGLILFDSSKPDGAMRKLTDVTKLHSLGWRYKINIEQGIKMLYDWYVKN